MNRKNTFKIVIAFVVVLALVLPGSANVEKLTNSAPVNNNIDAPGNNIQIFNKPAISINDDNINEGKVETTDSDSDIDWWPMNRHDLENSGFSTSVAPNTDNVIWIHNTGINKGRVWSSPAIVDERVYFGCDDGNFYCLNASDGSLIWNYPTGDWSVHSESHYIRSSPTVVDGKVFVGSLANNTYCLDASDGSLIWKYTTGDMVHSSPAVVDGKIFIGSNDNNLYCLDIDGELIWSFATGDNIISSPAVADGKIYVGSNDHKVYCLDIMDGSFVWNYTTGDWVVSSPAIVDGKVYVGSDDRKIYCLDADTGDLIWSYNTIINVISSSPAVADGKVYFGSDYDFYCLDASNGSLIWNNTGWGWGYSSPAIADGKIYTGSNHNFHCLNASDGSEIWEDNHPLLAFTGNPAIANKRVYIGRSTCCGNTTGNLYCYERSDHDIGIINRTSPVSGPATIFTPEVIIKNFGLNNETDVPVNMLIERIVVPNVIVEYNETVYISNIDVEETKSVIFPDWIPENLYNIPGFIRYRVTTSVQLVTDENPDNDCLIEMITLDYIHDVGVKEIIEPAPLRGDDWIHFDDGINYAGVGIIGGGTFEAAIRITPTDLEEYDTCELTVVKFYHRENIVHSGIIKIYESGTSNSPGSLITSEPYAVTSKGWFEIILSDTVLLDTDEDIWVSVEITHLPGEYPMGVDNGPAVDGKGDWFYSESLGWRELRAMGLNNNWNIWAKVEEIDPWPPGTYPVKCVVKNYGSFNESNFNINATIYNETEEIFYHDDFLVIATMYLQSEITVAFENVTFEGEDEGNYRLEVTTELNGDDNPLNNQAILNFIIGNDTTPPETTCILDGTMEGDVYITDVTVTLTATDDMSGVAETLYKLNDGEWQKYSDSFVVSDDGAHTMSFYSIDNAGNIEDAKSESFTIQHPCPIEIEISGGLGVSVVITNTGDDDITDLEWSINITGGLFGLIDKEVNDTISILAAGDSVTVKSGIFFGLGQISITVIACCAEETVAGKQFIIFTKVE